MSRGLVFDCGEVNILEADEIAATDSGGMESAAYM